MPIHFEYNPQKAIETLIYIAKRIDNPHYEDVLKLVYLADKTHLEKYGRFIYGETYCVMQRGAVPSHLYDLIKDAKTHGGYDFKIENYQIKSDRDAERNIFSESDTECLEQIVTIYGKLPSWKRGQDAHDVGTAAAWKKRGRRKSVPYPVESIAGLFEVSDELIEYLQHAHD